MGCPAAVPNHDSIVQTSVYFSLSAAVLLLRGGVRLRTRGWRRLQTDDHVAVFVLLCVVVVGFLTVSITRSGGTWIFIGNRAAAENLLECQVRKIRRASIYNIVIWYTCAGLIYGLKAMMLIFMNRLYAGMFRLLIRLVAAACVLACIAVCLVITFSCHPIQKNWQVQPLPREQRYGDGRQDQKSGSGRALPSPTRRNGGADGCGRCLRRKIDLYTVSGLHAVTEVLILMVPIALLWTVRVSIWRKTVLCLLFCSGFFSMATALLRIGLLYTDTQINQISNWGSREILIACVVVNMPAIAPVVNQRFWRRDYSGTAPYRPSNVVPGRPNTIGGPHGTARAAARQNESADSITLYSSVSDDDTNSDPATTITRNDSAAATMIKTISSGPCQFRVSMGGFVTEERDQVENALDWDLERDGSGDGLPVPPERALSWSRWSSLRRFDGRRESCEMSESRMEGRGGE